LPIDKAGADLLFPVISLRYEQGAILITSTRACTEWPKIFNNDSPLTAAILDRLLHPADTVLIAGQSFRMKERLDASRSRSHQRHWRSIVAAGDVVIPPCHPTFSNRQIHYIFTRSLTLQIVAIRGDVPECAIKRFIVAPEILLRTSGHPCGMEELTQECAPRPRGAAYPI
jgi:hypothetical protein